ncbi:DUF759 family protein (plasmid) [Borreliella finlandensis]|uniref:DUF759 family protein n=1 Tax=Borreliella finlandensis TaxID=498741 RepID=UPI003AF0A2E4
MKLSKDNLEFGLTSISKLIDIFLESRITKMMEMFKDFKSFSLTKEANTTEGIQSNLASAEQTLSDMTTTVLEPLLKFIKMLTNYFNGFNVSNTRC